MNANQYSSTPAGHPTGSAGGGMFNAQPNPNATSNQFQSNGAASQMVPLMLQMQPTGSISFFPLQAQTQAFQQSPQWLGMPSSQPSTISQSQPTQPPFVPGTPGFASPSHAMAAMNDLMTLAASMQQVPAEVPVGSLADDEEILVKALRKANARGLNYEQALRRLHNVNHHSEAAWKNYFLANLERLYAKTHARKGPQTTSGSTLQPLYLTSGGGTDLSQSPRSALAQPIKREKPPNSSYAHQKSSSRYDSGPRSEQTSHRHKAGTSSQGPHLVKAKMNASLASPKAIGIKKPRIRARRRIVRSPTPTPEPSAVSSSPESTEPEDRAYGVNDGPDSESEYGRAHTKRSKGLQAQRVTEEDFRAMARYMYENPRRWGESPTGLAYWRKFARREANASRRSLDAWARASRTHLEKILLYVEEYAGRVEQDGDSDVDETTPSTQDQELDEESSTQDVDEPSHDPAEAAVEEIVTVPQKRYPSPSRTTDQEGPDEKRMRQENSNNVPDEVSVTETELAGSSESRTSGDSIPVPQEAQPPAGDATPAVPLDAEKV
ncbi:hypothetical protein OH76DRAFT_748131 [Lentinus brumalis]|uniref:Uncharacterized protein n=1 Tax=Lentinus brumalis TaxID=2498619 RepID=A0A371DSP7_9APHY|nr:hypothetical protein OH76DRAFT_748131 [Polyporus brumalis]